MSRILKTALISAATLISAVSLSTTAQASCGSSLYCNSSSTTLKPLGSWTPASNYTHNSATYTNGTSYNTGSTRYISTPSISSGSTPPSLNTYRFYGSTSSVTGLGANESLRPTTCPTSVYNPEGGQVLGCYNVVQPVPQTRYYRVVRPVIYVRYPVPVAVPVYGCGASVVTQYSRYGGSYC